jgi:hypothetical protein
MVSDEPAMMASSFYTLAFDLCNFFLMSPAIVENMFLHFWEVPSTVQSGPLIQLRGVVRSAEK